MTGGVTHTLKAEGCDASEDGTGRAAPIIAYRTSPDCGAWETGDRTDALTTNSDQTAHVLAVALRGRNGGGTAELSDVPSALRASGGGGDKAHVLAETAVRRLTPTECERLQGFPDDYTYIPYRGGYAEDGPRYKAIGNSMAVPVMRWIGLRIERAIAIKGANR